MAVQDDLTPLDPSRRAVVTAAAWGAPAILLARSVPSAVASDLVQVDAFIVNGSCYSKTSRGQANEFRINWAFSLGASGLPAGTLIIIETTGNVYNHAYQISGGAIQQVGSSVVSGGVRTSTYTLTSTVYSITDMLTGFYQSASYGGNVWSCSLSIVLPSGYVAAAGSVAYGQVGETAPNQVVCTYNTGY